MNDTKYETKAGTLLLSEPFMIDGNFKKSVVLLCEHSNVGGTLGFVLNKELDIPVNDLLASFPTIELNVHFGGPVATDTIHYIHTIGDELEGSVKVCDGIWWGGDFEQLKQKVLTGAIDETNVRFFVGYSGWEAGQLRAEMKLGSWVLFEMDEDYFHLGTDDLWQRCMEDKGDTFGILSTVPTDKGVWS